MSARRQVARFLLGTLGLRRLSGTRLQAVTREVLDEIDLQSLRDTQSCVPFQDRAQMYRYVHDRCVNGGAIDYLEFGVFKGESIREWATINKHSDSRFFGFDSFEGLPEDWRDGQAKGHFGVQGAVPEFGDRRVSFIKGWFDKTIPDFVRQFDPRNHLVLHLDADLYSSTMLALIYLTPHMREGTLLIFDEFYDRQHEYKAFRDWLKVTGKSFQVLAQVDEMAKVAVQLS